MADKKISMKTWLAAACIICMICNMCILLSETALAAEDAAVDAAAGIIEVQSGFLDAAGQFRNMKSAGGFLIANKDNGTYIVTNCSTVSNTPRSIKKYCKKHAIKTENMQFSNYIQVVVKGDVTAQAEVVVKSAEKDYCVLSTANVVSQKESLKLGDSAGVKVSDTVYAYGFPKETGVQAEYTVMDAQASQGTIMETAAILDGGNYLAHSAPVGQGYAGGPLVDADGYVIGMNCKQSPEDDTGIAYALPVNEIRSVLDNFSIYYGSRAIDEAYGQLEDIYQECMDISKAGGYKKASMEALEQALAEAEKALAVEEPAASNLQEAYQTLAEARDGLVAKTKVLTIIIRILPILICILFIWTMALAVMNAKEKKLMNVPQNMGYQRQQGIQSMPRNAGVQRQPAPQNASLHRQPTVPPQGRRLRIIRQKTGQTVVVNKNQFILGKSQTQADFCVADNQTISRKHALLFENNGGWYIDDLNSLNGTFLNGRRIAAGQAAAVRDGDEIRLSDESFLVQG